jgi:hypothetical protein
MGMFFEVKHSSLINVLTTPQKSFITLALNTTNIDKNIYLNIFVQDFMRFYKFTSLKGLFTRPISEADFAIS